MNTYKTLLIILLTGICHSAFAQSAEAEEQKMRDRMEAFRAQFITEELELTPEEAQKFWPVYNQYRKEVDDIQEKRLKQHARLHGDPKEELAGLTDEEVYRKLEAEMKMQQNLLDLRQQYYRKFDEVLPIKKVALLYMAEGEFQRRLIRRLGERRHPKGE